MELFGRNVRLRKTSSEFETHERLVEPGDEEGLLMLAFLRSRGFKNSWRDRFFDAYSPPFLQPGGIAPRGDTGDDEVRLRVIKARRRAQGLPESNFLLGCAYNQLYVGVFIFYTA